MEILSKSNKHILVLGASGMLGNAVTRVFFEENDFSVVGTVRHNSSIALLPEHIRSNIVSGVDVNNYNTVVEVIRREEPDIVINCVGLVKQLSDVNDPLITLPVNALFPHRLARSCGEYGARLIHMSTDCVFSGSKGMYTENDYTDARDLYGISKKIGEVDYSNAITLRTSIIGHELDGDRSLIDWFLSQRGRVKGFSEVIFSGLPTVEIAKVIKNHVIPNEELRGVYHVSAEPVSKYDLLKLVASVYGHEIETIKDRELIIDRSLDSSRFRTATGFNPAPWDKMITTMRDFG